MRNKASSSRPAFRRAKPAEGSVIRLMHHWQLCFLARLNSGLLQDTGRRGRCHPTPALRTSQAGSRRGHVVSSVQHDAPESILAPWAAISPPPQEKVVKTWIARPAPNAPGRPLTSESFQTGYGSLTAQYVARTLVARPWIPGLPPRSTRARATRIPMGPVRGTWFTPTSHNGPAYTCVIWHVAAALVAADVEPDTRPNPTRHKGPGYTDSLAASGQFQPCPGCSVVSKCLARREL
jgi:hypothetical protein